MNVSRRKFLRGAAAGAAGSAITAAALVEGNAVDANAAAITAPAPEHYPFHGEHQSGILTPAPAEKQSFSSHVAFDITATDKATLAATFTALTGRARFLTSGGLPPDRGVSQPPPDSAVLGPEIPADGLTVTVAVGASLFDGRYGLTERKPNHLKPMTVFANDFPDPQWSHGDVLLQLCGHHPDTVHHALRDIMRTARGSMQMRWRIDGYNSLPRPSGTARNLLGFKDGTANPVATDAADLIWVTDPAEPSWTHGGSYQVVRLIRMLVEFWDRVSINEQERMFGRRRASGAPLDGNNETDIPNYAVDDKGATIPLDAHIRLANPRTPDTDNQRLLRRSYNYDLGVDPNGNMQSGHVFVCFQQNIARQFETIQNRLNDEPLVDYVQPFGGGYFFALPGLADEHDWYARTLLT